MTQVPDHDSPVLEPDETVPPRPEEEMADVARSRPDVHGHGDQGTGDEQVGAEA